MPKRTRPKPRFSQLYRRFLKLLRATCLEAGLTQTDTAKLLRQPQSFVAKCESGERRVDVAELIANQLATTPAGSDVLILQSFNESVTNQQILFAQEFERVSKYDSYRLKIYIYFFF